MRAPAIEPAGGHRRLRGGARRPSVAGEPARNGPEPPLYAGLAVRSPNYGCWPGGALPAGLVAGFCVWPLPVQTGCWPGAVFPPPFVHDAGVIAADAIVAVPRLMLSAAAIVPAATAILFLVITRSPWQLIGWRIS